jgi:hypothetical protein
LTFRRIAAFACASGVLRIDKWSRALGIALALGKRSSEK